MSSEWFAGRLRELRIEAGLSQPELANKAGMTKDGIAQLEQGRRSPSWATVLALASALGVEVGAFTVEPKGAPTPERGRPRKTPAAHQSDEPEEKPAARAKGKKK